EFGSLQFLEAVERLASDICEGAPAEVGHDGATLVEGIPEASCPIPADLGGVVVGPLPGEHALARTPNRVEQKHRVLIGGRGPVAQDVKLRSTAYKSVRTDVWRFGVECRRRGDGVAGLRSGLGFETTREASHGVDGFLGELLQTFERVI